MLTAVIVDSFCLVSESLGERVICISFFLTSMQASICLKIYKRNLITSYDPCHTEEAAYRTPPCWYINTVDVLFMSCHVAYK